MTIIEMQTDSEDVFPFTHLSPKNGSTSSNASPSISYMSPRTTLRNSRILSPDVTQTTFQLLAFGSDTSRCAWCYCLYCEYPLQDQTPACYHCREPENLYEAEKNDVIFTNALWQLLEVLALMGTYRGQGDAIGPLLLDFSAHSPSDAHHYFQWYHVQPDYPRLQSLENRINYVRRWCTDPAYIPVNDPGHGYGPDRAS